MAKLIGVMAKLITAIVVLVLGAALMILPGLGIMSVIEDNIQVRHEEYHFPDLAVFLMAGLIAIVLTLIGKPLWENRIGKILYIVLTGIVPGAVVCMGWQAIEEAKKEVGANKDTQETDTNQKSPTSAK